ncbi:unnamed protein product [Darwinula stevensoni]|uniref:Protein kinase domain-containing protein n=1 Tax=Darwinula stevensoni TaxID=69355 RepID=A0A7R8X6D3_9CRUS|nr:unnamed protein product [Darwinula stevensoni]CAG0888032.1 unnamed protein product [Darwinula stevensoni]
MSLDQGYRGGRGKRSQWVRTFDVTDPILHRRGYTVYKVLSRVFPSMAPEAATEIITWKRYSDFKRLHKEMEVLHKALHLKGIFPQFPKKSVFGRRKAALVLLEFIAQYPPLFTSQGFSKFFEEGQEVRPYNEVETLKDPPLIDEFGQTNIPKEPAGKQRTQEEIEDLLASAEQETVNETEQGTSQLGGIWNHPCPDDPLSLSGSSDDDACEEHTNNQSGNNEQNPVNPSNLFSLGPSSPARLKNPEDSESKVKSVQSGPEADLDLAFKFPEPPTEDPETPILSVPSVTDPTETTSDSFSPLTPISPFPGATESCAGPDAHYLFAAAQTFSAAQDLEAIGSYYDAFLKYKEGIGTLLQGVQTDKSFERREAVRRKTSHYLERAESIYNQYLAQGTGPSSNAPARSEQMKASPIRATERLRAPLTELNSYKVLGVVDGVLLAWDKTSQNHCIIKIITKSVDPVLKNKPTIVPYDVPFLVNLECFFETESAIYLVLQYARGGKLWDFVSSYIHSNISTPVRVTSRSRLSSINKGSNIYSGLRLNERDSATDLDTSSVTPTNPKSSDFATDPDLEASNECPESFLQLFVIGSGGSSDTSEEHIPAAVSNSAVDAFETKESSETFDRSLVRSTAGDVEDLIVSSQQLLSNVERVLAIHKDHSKDVEDCKEKNGEVMSLLKRRGNNRELRISAEKSSRSGRKRSVSFDIDTNELRSCMSTPSHMAVRWRPSSGESHLEELRTPLGHLPESCIHQWAAEIVTAVSCLHDLGIVCSDLNPSNILLGEGGHILLTHFSSWPCVDRVISVETYEGGYVAQEVMLGHAKASKAADWWSIGALLYELLCGQSLVSAHPGGVHQYTTLRFPDHLSEEAKSLLTQLLRADPVERLMVDDIRAHPFFQDIDWSSMK